MSSQAHQLFVEELPLQIEPVLSFLHKTKRREDSISIADVGGNGSIVAEALVDTLREDFPKIHVDVFDVEENSFSPDTDSISYHQHDAVDPLPKQYDITFARSMLHYNSFLNQHKIISNMVLATKPNDLVTIVQPAPLTEQQQIDANTFYEFVARLTNTTPKRWMNYDELRDAFEVAGAQFISARILNPRVYTVLGFYRERYHLDEKKVCEAEAFLGEQKGIPLATVIMTGEPCRTTK